MHSAIKIAKIFVDKANATDGGCADMTLLKLMKMTYIAHGWMLGIYKKPLISEDVEAWQYGPVIPELYRETKQFGRNPVTSLPEDYTVDLSENEESVVDQTYENYKSFTAGQLVTLTHERGTPWDTITKTNLLSRRHYGPGVIIPNELIDEYYSNRYSASKI